MKVGLILAGAVIVYMAYAGGMFGNPAPTASVVTAPTTGGSTVVTTSTSGTGLKGGDLVTVNVNARDALTEAAYTEATHTKTTYLLNNNGVLTVQTTGTAQTVQVSNDGRLWISFETQASGQTYIFAVDKTFIANGDRMNNDCSYIDIEADGTKEYLCSFNTTGLTPEAANFGTKPTLNIQTKWWDYTAATISSPADVTSIGTTAGTSKFTTWTLTNTVGDISQITRIQYKINSTSDSKWTQGEMYVQFKDIPKTISLNDFRKWQDGTSTYYECIVGPNLDCTGGGYNIATAYKLPYAVNGPGTHTIEVKNYWNLATSDVLTTTLIIDQTNEIDGAVTALSDAKNNSA